MAANLKKNLEIVSDDIKKLSQKIEKLIMAIDESAKSKPVKAKSAKKTVVNLRKKAPSRKKTQLPAHLVVLEIIENSDQRVDVGKLKEKSGFQGQKLYNALYTLKKQGKVKNPSKGIYEKV